MIDFHQAHVEMFKGNVVKYIGTVNGNVFTKSGISFCMCRNVVFEYKDGNPVPRSFGAMLYDPDFRYELTGEVVDTKVWPKRNLKPITKYIYGFIIQPPVSDAACFGYAYRTFGLTAQEAWIHHCCTFHDDLDISRKIQDWHDRGYRLREAILTIPPRKEEDEGSHGTLESQSNET